MSPLSTSTYWTPAYDSSPIPPSMLADIASCTPARTSAVPQVYRKRGVSGSFARRLAQGGSADARLRMHARQYVWAENVVTRLRLANDIDLRRITAWWYHAYIPHRFETFTARLRDQRNTTILLFRTGRAVLAGTQSMEHTYQGLHRMRLELEAIGKATSLEELELVNMVYVDSIESVRGVDLARMYVDNMDKAEWSPTTFPGMKLTDPRFDVKYRIFDTPVLLVMGSKSAYKISEILSHAKSVISPYRDDALPGPDGRFDYRREKKRLACSEMNAADIPIVGDDDAVSTPRFSASESDVPSTPTLDR
jgi:TATA-box binding protein (TBP) (component of TFIID and TFIIIB)